jgi:UDP-N-acetylglucosamine diphosphorylase/glucosamine-1-phosphate N-acetyltransferase
MKLVIYENETGKFSPIIGLYPQFELRIGMKTIAEHTIQFYPRNEIAYISRSYFGHQVKLTRGPVLYISSQCILNKKIQVLHQDTKLLCGQKVVGLLKRKPPFPVSSKDIQKLCRSIKRTVEVDGIVLNTMCDLIRYNEPVMQKQFKSLRNNTKIRKRLAIIGKKDDLYIAGNAKIYSHVVFDTSNGPVYVDKHSVIRPFSTIIGPSYIGHETIVDRAKVTASSIGPGCRIGGEVESCIFQGYSNKYHEGFIGHSFIGEWVNLGAMTTNSDLKNNYGEVRVFIGKKRINSKMKKLGCFIADHTKLGIGTLIPTGAVIGSFVNFFGGGMTPLHVPAFTWLTSKKQERYDLMKALDTARTVLARRSRVIDEHYKGLIRRLFRCRTL